MATADPRAPLVDALGDRGQAWAVESWVAAIAAVLVGVKLQLPFTAPFSIVVATLALPVAAVYLRRFQGALLLSVCVVCAVVAGVLITWGAFTSTSTSLLVAQSVRLLSLPMVLAVMLWVRSVLDTRRLIFYFAIGMIASVIINGVNPVNPWKFDYGLPVTLLLLSLPPVFGRRVPQLIVAIGLATVSVLFDSRSAAGFLLVSAALTVMQGTRRRVGEDRPSSARSTYFRYLQVGVVLVGAYFLLQAAILEGMLGDEIQVRTQAQIDASGSLIAGGRPEMGATVALISANPWGFGSGALPTPTQILVAKEGMAQLGYDPDNGYVDKYMFGGSFEVHSEIGDLWLSFGLLGALVAIVCAVSLVRGVGYNLATGVASTAAIYAATRSIWDLGFSPLYTSITLLPLAIAVVAKPARMAEREKGRLTDRARGARRAGVFPSEVG